MSLLIKIIKIVFYSFIFTAIIGNCMVTPDETESQIISEQENQPCSSVNKNDIESIRVEDILDYEDDLSISKCQKKQILKIKRKDSYICKKSVFKRYFYQVKSRFGSLRRKKSFKINKNRRRTNEDTKENNLIVELNTGQVTSEHLEDTLDDHFAIVDNSRDKNEIIAETSEVKKKRNSIYQVHKHVKKILPDIIENLSISEKSDDSNELSDNFFCEVIGNNSRRSLILSYYQPEEGNISNEICYLNHHIARVNEFFLSHETYSKNAYAGYYTPYYLMQNQDYLEGYLPAAETDDDEYIHISVIIKQTLIIKMLQKIGKAYHKKMEIPLHDHYLIGIHLAINIFTKLQFVLIYDKDIMHSIKFIEDHDKAIELISRSHNKHNVSYNSYFLDCFNLHEKILINLHKPVSLLTDENIYGLILTKIKISEDNFLDLTKLKFVLYAFESAIAQEQVIDDITYIYQDYYIAIVTISMIDQQDTRFYKIKQKSTDDIGSDVFDLFTEDKLQELIDRQQHNNQLEDTHFMVTISLVIPYKKNIQLAGVFEKSNVNVAVEAPLLPIGIANGYEEQSVYDVPPFALIKNNYEDHNIYDSPPFALIKNNYEGQGIYDVPRSINKRNTNQDQIIANNSPDSCEAIYVNGVVTKTNTVENNLVESEAKVSAGADKVESTSNIQEIKDISEFFSNKQTVFKRTMPLFLIFNINDTQTD